MLKLASDAIVGFSTLPLWLALNLGFAVSFVSLCGFCYKLVQLRNFDVDRTYGQQSWFNAA